MTNAQRSLLWLLATLFRPAEWDESRRIWKCRNAIMGLMGMRISREAGVAAGFWCNAGGEKWLTVMPGSGFAYQGKVIANGPIEVGLYTTIAAGVTLINWGDGIANLNSSLSIGRGCWIGAGSTICGPLTIGDFAVIGAGSFVNRDVPSKAVVVGRPATVLNYRTVPEKVWLSASKSLDTSRFVVNEESAV